MADARLLDELAANATTAGTTQQVDGWRLRAAPHLPFRRSNVVVPLAGAGPALDVASRIAVAERFYRDRGLPVRFQVSSAAEPPDLDQRLAVRGYVVDAPVDVYVAPTDRVLRESVDTPARIEQTVHLDWIEAFGETQARLESYVRLLAEIEPRSAAAVVDLDGSPAAVGLGVLERGWVGVFGMVTRSTARRRGAVRSVLRSLAEWAHDEQAHDLYLQVETDNVSAQALYASVGFVRSHSYHYRVLV